MTASRPDLDALRPELHRYCARLLGSVIDGEDVVQDTFIRAMTAPPGPEVPARAWLFRVAHNRAMDVLRARAIRHVEPLDDAYDIADNTAPDPLDALLHKDAVSLAIDRFTALSVPQRSAVILKDVLDEPLADIADLLGLSVDAVKAHLARGRARLRTLGTTQPAPSPRTSPETERFVSLFNARNWDALRALLAADARLQQSTYPLRTGSSVRDFFGIYASYDAVRLAPAWLGDREVIAVFEGADTAPRHIMWLEWSDGFVQYIRDYRYIPYVIAEIPVPLQ
ncbi:MULTISPECIES: RNA polymerase sigma factor [Asticcacaulis]|uniref:RNA polymerase sigma factor n=1 Tax=Asticcacaulis TaxID=76890 RepID=UPI001AE219D1|nr:MULTISPECIES: RNA polymerase sigma factor [Asticcacaulis]MBP2160455.1 RNA polymerase sigma-70 factor (ECF subfamily) [Asticcacaulis solisilvae]MDR6801500.1 RNA polymerase sigma-70 factor (ECF subfamily) [Asticcacaulis sp. BE141]